MTCIYKIRNPLTDNVFYIGQTIDFESRKLTHLKRSHNSKLNGVISEIVKSGQLPVFEIIEFVQSEIANYRERIWINHFRDMGIDLCNKKAGISEKLMCTTLNGKPATQKNVTLEDDYFASIVESGKLKYDSFSTYVRKLIDADLATTSTTTPA